MLKAPANVETFVLLQERAHDVEKRLEMISAALAALWVRAATLDATLADLELRLERLSVKIPRTGD